MKNIFCQIPGFQAGTSPLVLATIIGTTGSTPQKPGSSILFGKAGIISGTIGGGVLEGNVQQIAQNAIKSKESGLYSFDLDHDIFHKEDAICGGQVNVLVDASPYNHLEVYKGINTSLEKRIPGVLITVITGADKNKTEVNRYWNTGNEKHGLPVWLFQKTDKEVKNLLANGKQGDCRELEFTLPEEKEPVLIFLEALFPLPHLIIAGAGHIGKALAKLGSLLDFEVTVMDDRLEFANPENIPDADHFIVGDIGKAMSEIRKSNDTYIVIVTRGHKDDEKALRPCIDADVAYIGMIGSRNKVALMRENFISNSWATKEQWERIYSPVGLEINSKTVWEITVSIGAQLIQMKNRIAISNRSI